MKWEGLDHERGVADLLPSVFSPCAGDVHSPECVCGGSGACSVAVLLSAPGGGI